MNMNPRSLFNLDAADLMTTDLVLLPQEMSLPAAARIMSRAGVTGAPVVDHEGWLVGVFSATDYMLGWDRAVKNKNHTASDPACMAKAWAIPDEPSTEGDCTVADFMTKDPVTVPLDMPIAALARLMVEAHIHRVVVAEPDRRPRGVISTLDILAALVIWAPPTTTLEREPVRSTAFPPIPYHAAFGVS